MIKTFSDYLEESLQNMKKCNSTKSTEENNLQMNFMTMKAHLLYNKIQSQK